MILKIANVSDEDIPVNMILNGREIACFLQEAEVTVPANPLILIHAELSRIKMYEKRVVP